MKACDRILFLENGSLVGNGKHDDLLENFPHYKAFFESLLDAGRKDFR